MDIKKVLLAGSAVTAMVLATSCSSDSSSTEPDPVDPTVSSSSEGGANPDPTSSAEGSVTVSSSSVSGDNPQPELSSAAEVVDSSVTQMAITEIMYNAADGSALEWIEVTIQSGPDIASMLASQMRLDGALSFGSRMSPLRWANTLS